MENTCTCKICGLSFNKLKSLENHKYNKHRFYNKGVDYVIMKNKPLKSWLLKDVATIIVKQFYKLHKEFNNFSLLLDRQFLHFHNLITSVRDFHNDDFNTFFSKFLEWKEKNPKLVNSKELCYLVFQNENEAEIAYSRMKEKNPFTGHTGEYSPFSKNFCGYKGMADEDIEKLRINATKHDVKGRNTNQVEYWIKKGFSEEEAKIKVRERQRTFTIEKCIEKYGKEQGTKRWQERQEKWLRNYKKQNFSNVSQNLFWTIYNKIKNLNLDIRFATIDENKEKDTSGKNNEYLIKTKKSFVKPDFVILDSKKVIEFDGDYWHGKGRGNKLRDKERDKSLQEMGFQVLHILEKDFKINPEKIINECLNFIKEK